MTGFVDQTEFLTRLVFQGQSLADLVNIVYGPENQERAIQLSTSLAGDKVVDYTTVPYYERTVTQQRVLEYIYNTYQATFGDFNNQVYLSNRLRYLRSFEFEEYINDTIEQYTQEQNRYIGYARRNFLPAELNGRLIVGPNPVIRDVPSTNTIAYKDSYLIRGIDTDNYESLAVYDIGSARREARNSRFRVTRTALTDARRVVGVRFDPEVYDNSFTFSRGRNAPTEESLTLFQDFVDLQDESEDTQSDFINGEINLEIALSTLTDEQLEVRDQLIEEGVLDEDEFVVPESDGTDDVLGLLPSISRVSFTFNQRWARDLLGLINGRVNRSGYALYIRTRVEEGLLRPLGGGLYTIRNTAFAEFVQPVFNFNLQPGRAERLIFDQTGSDTFNYNNLYLYNI